MARYNADGASVKFFYESGTYAATSGTAHWIGLVSNNDIDDEENITQIRYVGGASRNIDMQLDGAEDTGGTATFHPQDWKSLMFAMGSIADAGSPSPYTHEIRESNSNDGNQFTSGAFNPFISFTIEDAQTAPGTGQNFIRTQKGCSINTWELTVEEGEPAEVTVNYVGQKNTFTSGAATSVTANTLRPFMWNDFKVNLPNSTNLPPVKSFTFGINNNLTPSHYDNGSRVGEAPEVGTRQYNVDLTLDARSEDTKTLYDTYYRGGSEFNMEIVQDVVSAGTGSRDATIVLSGCRIPEMDTPTANEGITEHTISVVPQKVTADVNDSTELYAPW